MGKPPGRHACGWPGGMGHLRHAVSGDFFRMTLNARVSAPARKDSCHNHGQSRPDVRLPKLEILGFPAEARVSPVAAFGPTMFGLFGFVAHRR